MGGEQVVEETSNWIKWIILLAVILGFLIIAGPSIIDWFKNLPGFGKLILSLIR